MRGSRGTDIHPAADSGIRNTLANGERIGIANNGGNSNSGPG